MNDETNRPSLRAEFIAACVIVALGVLWTAGLLLELIPPLLLGAIIVLVPFWVIGMLFICTIIKALLAVFSGGHR